MTTGPSPATYLSAFDELTDNARRRALAKARSVPRGNDDGLWIANMILAGNNMPPVTELPNADSPKRPELRLVREEDAS